MQGKIYTIFLILILAISATGQQTLPPVAPIRTVTDTYWGTEISDPYRWMEDLKNPEVIEWMKEQNDYARATLERIPVRRELLARIQELNNSGVKVQSVQQSGDRYFYFKITPESKSRKLYMRENLGAEEKLLVDPERIGTGQAAYSIDFFKASPDGRYVAYGVSSNGTEDRTLHVVDATDGRELEEKIDGVRLSNVNWGADNLSIYYNKLQDVGPDHSPRERLLNSKIFRHQLGAKAESDQPIFGCGIMVSSRCEATDLPFVIASPKYIFVFVYHGVSTDFALYYAPVLAINGTKTSWQRLFDTDAEVTDFDIKEDDLYLLSHRNAPRYKIIHTKLPNVDMARADVVMSSGNAVITRMGAAKDALYVQLLDGGIGKIVRVPYDNARKLEPISLPSNGSIGELYTDTSRDGALFRLTSWTTSPYYYNYDPQSGKIQDTKLLPLSPVDFSQIESVEVKARSADGIMIPLSIIYQKGTNLDGSHPMLLEGYGAYGFTMEPNFEPKLLAWLERGGVYAVAHVRGGGEYGEEWHQAGRRLNKQNSINDFIACAQYLIEQKYTKPSLLGAFGRSGGGILMGGIITQRPDLFAAVICEVGLLNPLRFETEANGLVNRPEFGSIEAPDGFKSLYAMDSYVHVRDKTPYPAVMLMTGFSDPRVAPWQSAKMAARLQAATSSGKPVLLRVDYNAGHGYRSASAERALLTADEFSFLLWQMGKAAH
jgi:prolyl oligopeptidase